MRGAAGGELAPPRPGATTVYDGRKIDYLFRANPRSWSADAYQTFTYWYYGSTGVVASDHKLTEGFL